ncbi:MAG: LysE family translocator [Nostocales cyanobacterium]|nr:MAG: LysE family translocator [Nostocales cyanobacterium]TAF14861.1 MAG: LysE family translocator [Nostocales cyanobacterium]
MTITNIIALFGAMIVLASIPSVSVVAVSTRAATLGFIHGIFTTIGIVLGDIFFIILAIWGLSFLAETMGNLFLLIKYLGGAYLIFLGMGLWKSRLQEIEQQEVKKYSLFSSFLTGFLITLGDQKATLFYLGFFPAFIDINKITFFDTIIVIAITILAVGGVKISYAFIANKARLFVSNKVREIINIAASIVLISVGIFLIIKH